MKNEERVDRWLVRRAAPARVERMWRAIEHARGERPAQRRVVWAVAAALLLACGVGTAVGVQSWLARPVPLALDGGAALPRVFRGDTSERVRFSDGSHLTLQESARVEVLESVASRAAFALRRGRARFDVVPGGPRAWRVECGKVTVEVIGTSFTVAREGHAVRVRVMHGVVLVRGEGVLDGVQRLGEGQELVTMDESEHVRVAVARDVPPAPHVAPERTAAPPSQAEANGDPTPASPAPARFAVTRSALARSELGASAAAWQQAARAGEYERAFEALGATGVDGATRAAADVDELLTLADVARLSGHPRDALAPLARIVAEHPYDRRASISAYTGATLYLDVLDEPARAVERLERAVVLGLPSGLREAASARYVEALSRAHDPRVREAAEAYLSAYPSGRYRASVERWSAP